MESDRTSVVELVSNLSTSLRVLDALGWSEKADRSSYELPVDADVVRLLEFLLARNDSGGGGGAPHRYDEGAPVKETALIEAAYAAEQAERSERRANEAAIAVANIRSER